MTQIGPQARLNIVQKGLGVRRAASSTDTGGSQFALHDDGDMFGFYTDTSDTLDQHIHNSCEWYRRAVAAQGGDYLLFLKGSGAGGGSRYTLEPGWDGKGDDKTLPKTASGGSVHKSVSISSFGTTQDMRDWIIATVNAFPG